MYSNIMYSNTMYSNIMSSNITYSNSFFWNFTISQGTVYPRIKLPGTAQREVMCCHLSEFKGLQSGREVSAF